MLEDVHPPGDGELNNIEFPVVPILDQHLSFDLWGEYIDIPAVDSETDTSIDDKTELIIFYILEDIPSDGEPNENTIFL